jgi:hypothetical protein
MSRSPDYDIEAADLVARTLRAVAADTDVADRHEAAAPTASLPSPIDLRARRARRLRRTVAATAAAAAVLVAALVWAGRDPSGEPDTPDLGTSPQGLDGAPTPLAPGEVPEGLEAVDDAVPVNGVPYFPQAFVLEPEAGGEILTAVINWPDGGPATAAELDHIVQALATVTGADQGPAMITAPDGESGGYLTLPLGDVDEATVAQVHDVLVAEGIGVQRFAVDSGWTETPVDISWVPGIAPAMVQSFSDGGAGGFDLYTASGDLASAGSITALLDGATPYPVDGSMGWQATLPSRDTVVVWQVAPGTVGAVVAGEGSAADISAVIESIPAPAPALGEHPNVRLVGRSGEGSDVAWAVEAADYIPDPISGHIPGPEERPCMSLWVAGRVSLRSCGLSLPVESHFNSFGAVTQVDDDVTVVFGEVAPTVASVSTDAPGAEQSSVDAVPLDPDDPNSLRYVVLIVHGGREEPQTFRFLGAGGELLDSRAIDLNEVGG